MKHSLLRALKFTGIFAVTVFALLVITILSPNLQYAYATEHGNYTIYSSKPLDPAFLNALDQADRILRSSELYRSDRKMKICLNDGPMYTSIVRAVRPNGFAWSITNIIVLNGDMDLKRETVSLNDYPMNLPRLLAHEATHCLQYNRWGMFAMSPFSSIPEWKIEGYAEYIARERHTPAEINQDVFLLHKAESKPNNGWISFPDSSGVVMSLDHDRLLVSYALDVEGLSYAKLLQDTSSEGSWEARMTEWCSKEK